MPELKDRPASSEGCFIFHFASLLLEVVHKMAVKEQHLESLSHLRQVRGVDNKTEKGPRDL